MWTLIRIWLAALCLSLFSACATNSPPTANEPPTVIQCSADAIAACAPLVVDDVAQCATDRPAGAGCAAAALKADATNRARHIECQQRQQAAAACLRELEASGILRPRQ